MPTAFGPFELVTRLAQGPVFETWHARSPEFGECVVKKLASEFSNDSHFVRAFFDDTALAQGFSHPNAARLFEAGDLGGTVYVAQEKAEGVSLQQVLINAGRPLTAAEAMTVFRPVLRALAAAHALSPPLLHRDLTPRNVWCSAAKITLLDFGLGRARARSGQLRTTSISPEQSHGQPADTRSEVFTAGLLLYELVCGRLPVDGGSSELMSRLALGELDAARTVNPSIDPQVDAVLTRALAVDPSARFESIADFAAALNDLPSEPLGALINPPAPVVVVAAPSEGVAVIPRRRRVALVLGGVLLAGLSLAWIGRTLWVVPPPRIKLPPVVTPPAGKQVVAAVVPAPVPPARTATEFNGTPVTFALSTPEQLELSTATSVYVKQQIVASGPPGEWPWYLLYEQAPHFAVEPLTESVRTVVDGPSVEMFLVSPALEETRSGGTVKIDGATTLLKLTTWVSPERRAELNVSAVPAKLELAAKALDERFVPPVFVIAGARPPWAGASVSDPSRSRLLRPGEPLIIRDPGPLWLTVPVLGGRPVAELEVRVTPTTLPPTIDGSMFDLFLNEVGLVATLNETVFGDPREPKVLAEMRKRAGPRNPINLRVDPLVPEVALRQLHLTPHPVEKGVYVLGPGR